MALIALTLGVTTLANQFTLMAISSLICLLIFVLSVIDMGGKGSFYLLTIFPLFTVLHHITLVILYRRKGGYISFHEPDAPGSFVTIKNLLFLSFLAVSWLASCVFVALLASFAPPKEHRPPPFFPISFPRASFFGRLVASDVMGFLELIVLIIMFVVSIKQRQRYRPRKMEGDSSRWYNRA